MLPHVGPLLLALHGVCQSFAQLRSVVQNFNPGCNLSHTLLLSLQVVRVLGSHILRQRLIYCYSSVDVHSSEIIEMYSLAENTRGFFYGEKVFTHIKLRQTLAFRFLDRVLVDIQILLKKLNVLGYFTHIVAF